MTGKTFGEALHWASSFLHQAFSESGDRPGDELRHVSRAEAEALFCHVAKCTRLTLLTCLQNPVPDEVLATFEEVVAERAKGRPLQYITGFAPFYGRDFAVREGACLIPRPETEVLAELSVRFIREHRMNAHIVDIGTGSGILAVTLALEGGPLVQVDAVDISEDAIRVARENAERHHADVTFHHMDGLLWLESLAKRSAGGGTQGIHLLVSNPPYIPTRDIEGLDEEVRAFEPHLALDGGPDGLVFYRRIAQLGDGMFGDGPCALYLEVGQGQAEDVRRMFAEPEPNLWPNWQFGVAPDLRGVGRVVYGTRR